MEAEVVAVCAALYTGFVWGAGSLSTWLAVEPMRKRLRMLEAWRDRTCELSRQAGEANADWAGRLEDWGRKVEDCMKAQADVLKAQQGQMLSVRDDVERLRSAMMILLENDPNAGNAPAGSGKRMP